VIGFVVAVDRGRYTCMVDGRPVTAMKARELGRGSVVVGDLVSLAGDVSGATGSLARIVRVSPRSSALRRSADDTDPVERVIVANADQMLIVCALASPPPRPRFVDRCLVAAYDAGLSPILVLTKADLGSPALMQSLYEPLDVPMVPTEPGVLGTLPSLLDEKISVLIGQSGVGKSTLVNTLVPDAVRAVGSVNPVTGRGRHTSSSAVAFPYQSGWLIDTPGLRGFGLGHVSASRVIEAFGDLASGVAECPADCDHTSADCRLDDWARAHGAAERLDSLRRLLASQAGTDTEQLTAAPGTSRGFGLSLYDPEEGPEDGGATGVRAAGVAAVPVRRLRVATAFGHGTGRVAVSTWFTHRRHLHCASKRSGCSWTGTLRPRDTAAAHSGRRSGP
jgi:ribosome biogenesis GTPase / thiamine phosphate phosphatase